MAVDHPARARPPGGLAALLGQDVRTRGAGGLDVGRGDALHQHGASVDRTDHTAHEFRGIRAVLQLEIAARLLRQDKRVYWVGSGRWGAPRARADGRSCARAGPLPALEEVGTD